MDDLIRLDAATLGAGIAAGEISSVQLTRACLDQMTTRLTTPMRAAILADLAVTADALATGTEDLALAAGVPTQDAVRGRARELAARRNPGNLRARARLSCAFSLKTSPSMSLFWCFFNPGACRAAGMQPQESGRGRGSAFIFGLHGSNGRTSGKPDSDEEMTPSPFPQVQLRIFWLPAGVLTLSYLGIHMSMNPTLFSCFRIRMTVG